VVRSNVIKVVVLWLNATFLLTGCRDVGPHAIIETRSSYSGILVPGNVVEIDVILRSTKPTQMVLFQAVEETLSLGSYYSKISRRPRIGRSNRQSERTNVKIGPNQPYSIRIRGTVVAVGEFLALDFGVLGTVHANDEGMVNFLISLYPEFGWSDSGDGFMSDPIELRLIE